MRQTVSPFPAQLHDVGAWGAAQAFPELHLCSLDVPILNVRVLP